MKVYGTRAALAAENSDWVRFWEGHDFSRAVSPSRPTALQRLRADFGISSEFFSSLLRDRFCGPPFDGRYSGTPVPADGFLLSFLCFACSSWSVSSLR
jgi:hypothetical protein